MSAPELLARDAALLARVSCRNTTWPRSSIRAAHSTMQIHLDCLVGECPAKTAAHKALEEAGHLTPDSGRPRR
ncbi:hypothetical protein [Nocardia lijiangensis]|uniref:hypothetical protein n=1 Tax=Nocardia lijiangensis TaxID=299618 RepID=UPI003D7231B3